MKFTCVECGAICDGPYWVFVHFRITGHFRLRQAAEIRQVEIRIFVDECADIAKRLREVAKPFIPISIDPNYPYTWKRQRDYPTLKQGLHDPKFRNKRR